MKFEKLVSKWWFWGAVLVGFYVFRRSKTLTQARSMLTLEPTGPAVPISLANQVTQR